MIGIYKIVNKTSNKIYVGSSVDVKRRWSQHISQLRSGKHQNQHLQFSWNKYGEDSFDFVIVEECPLDMDFIIEREQFWVDSLKSYDGVFGYNVCECVKNPMVGRSHSAATRKKISNINAGRVHSLETRAKVSERTSGENNPMFGRYRGGEEGPRAKLTWEKVIEIRRLRSEGVSCSKIANDFGVQRACISKIANNKRWLENV